VPGSDEIVGPDAAAMPRVSPRSGYPVDAGRLLGQQGGRPDRREHDAAQQPDPQGRARPRRGKRHRALSPSSRKNCWNKKPTRRARNLESCGSDMAEMSSPAILDHPGRGPL
jgi:hypothetical protein